MDIYGGTLTWDPKVIPDSRTKSSIEVNVLIKYYSKLKENIYCPITFTFKYNGSSIFRSHYLALFIYSE